MSSSIGTVTTKIFRSKEAFTFADGGVIPGFDLAYETYGELNAAKDNTILVFHALSGTQHAAGSNTSVPEAGDLWTEEIHEGWWDAFIGPGRALDTNRFCVICANYIGGCHGSTGPASINLETDKPYAATFPRLAVSDIVRSQTRLLDSLGIDVLAAVIGPSTGGLACINFATLFPERTKLVIPIATGGKTTVLNRLFLLEQILAVENDPHFQGGNYYDGPPPALGLTLARMISHKCFVQS